MALCGRHSVAAKKTLEEHARTQAEFLEQKLEPALAEAREGVAHIFFVDAAHSVMGSFLYCAWYLIRLMTRAASGRQRYSVCVRKEVNDFFGAEMIEACRSR
jgi:hypothetical protein